LLRAPKTYSRRCAGGNSRDRVRTWPRVAAGEGGSAPLLSSIVASVREKQVCGADDVSSGCSCALVHGTV
jgi:hypothetical protein